MATLDILRIPDPRLRLKSEAVTTFDGALKALIAELFETMYQAPGVGLAAPQANVQKRVIVMDVSQQEGVKEPRHFVNPVITAKKGSQKYLEGCLSVPNIQAEIERAEWITLEAFDENGKAIHLEATGLLAVCIQHEIDHLDGKLFIDYLSPLKLELLQKKIKKQQKQGLSI